MIRFELFTNSDLQSHGLFDTHDDAASYAHNVLNMPSSWHFEIYPVDTEEQK